MDQAKKAMMEAEDRGYRGEEHKRLEHLMGLFSSRLDAIRKLMWSSHAGSADMPTASMGSDRELFINTFLHGCMPPVCRFGTGMVVDENNAYSRQLDIVIENPFLPSVPLHALGTSRMYMSEGVAAVVEVKSNLYKQWDAANDVAASLLALKRKEIAGSGYHFPSRAINCMAVGYEGYKEPGPLATKLNNSSIGAVLILEDPGLFVSKDFPTEGGTGVTAMTAVGGEALWRAICYLCASAGCFADPVIQPTDYPSP